MKNLVANYLGQFYIAALSIFFVPIYINLMGLEAYGLVGLFVVIQTMFSLLDLGMGPAIGRVASQYKAGAISIMEFAITLRSVEIFMTSFALIAAVLLFILSDMLSLYWIGDMQLASSEVADVFRVMAVIVAARLMEVTYRSSFLGLTLHLDYNLISASIATVRAIGAVIVLTSISSGVMAFFLWQMTVAIFSLVAMMSFLYWKLRIRRSGAKFSMASIKKIWKFAAGMFLIAVLSMCVGQIDKIFLVKFTSMENFAKYMIANAASGFLFMFAAPITQTYFSRFCVALAGEEVALRRLFHESCQLLVVCVGVVAAIIFFAAEPLLLLWLGNEEIVSSVAPILQIIVVANYLNCLSFIPYQLQLANGWTSLSVKMNLLAIFIMAIGILVLVPNQGPIAAAYLWLSVSMLFLFVGTSIMFTKILRAEYFNWLWGDVIAPTIFMFLSVFVVCEILKFVESKLMTLLVLIIAVVIGLASGIVVSPHIRRRLISLL